MIGNKHHTSCKSQCRLKTRLFVIMEFTGECSLKIQLIFFKTPCKLEGVKMIWFASNNVGKHNVCLTDVMSNDIQLISWSKDCFHIQWQLDVLRYVTDNLFVRQYISVDSMGHSGACISRRTNPDSKVNGANMGPIWGRQDPGGSHVGPMNFAIWEVIYGPVNGLSLVWGQPFSLSQCWNSHNKTNVPLRNALNFLIYFNTIWINIGFVDQGYLITTRTNFDWFCNEHRIRTMIERPLEMYLYMWELGSYWIIIYLNILNREILCEKPSEFVTYISNWTAWQRDVSINGI